MYKSGDATSKLQARSMTARFLFVNFNLVNLSSKEPVLCPGAVAELRRLLPGLPLSVPLGGRGGGGGAHSRLFPWRTESMNDSDCPGVDEVTLDAGCQVLCIEPEMSLQYGVTERGAATSRLDWNRSSTSWG